MKIPRGTNIKEYTTGQNPRLDRMVDPETAIYIVNGTRGRMPIAVPLSVPVADRPEWAFDKYDEIMEKRAGVFSFA